MEVRKIRRCTEQVEADVIGEKSTLRRMWTDLSLVPVSIARFCRVELTKGRKDGKVEGWKDGVIE